MRIEAMPIADVKLITPKIFRDERGFFSETWNSAALAAHGIGAAFVQDNHALSVEAGVLRGLHFQIPPDAQGKLVRVVRGSVYDVAVDVRHGSPTYGKHVSAILSAENWSQLWVPPGFAHGYQTLEPGTEVVYKVTALYAPESDRGIAWNDPALAIDWPIKGTSVILSEKDRKLPRLAEIPAYFSMTA